ncbi:hypothetical protein Fokcrypt_00658 [Candidatus Fokinia cryptica]|uniref:Uncharacterized protein n=1 Tax=Candidatus Fokinia crypta TaxID=1920990 RepID=A0ABZ0UPS4_9RICK|nr:hypothetical protein Fokcrypt_00658 [Candidatus Fokinia cryptica]
MMMKLSCINTSLNGISLITIVGAIKEVVDIKML